MQVSEKILSGSLSIVIPYYNEEANIDASLGGALDYLRVRFADYEVVAVDDASTDGTAEKMGAWSRYDRRLRVIRLPENTRFAGALKAGLAAATKEFVFYTDGDCPIDYNEIDQALERMDRCDVVIGYRRNRDREGWRRKVYTRGYRLLLRLTLGLRYRDINFSFKLFRRSCLQAIDLGAVGSFIDAEILYCLQKAKCRIMEIPVYYHSRRAGRSTLASPIIVWQIVKELARFCLKNAWSSDKAIDKGALFG